MKKFTPFFIALFLLMGFHSFAQNLVINEILSSNTYTNADEDGEYNDWVELYNGTSAAINLNGYGLTDDSTLPFKWVFPAQTIGAGQYLLIYCSDKNRTVAGQPLHTNFKISASGEVITLTNAASLTVSQVPATVIPSDVSYGRLPNGTGPFVFFGTPTPNAVNNTTGYNEVLNPPTFSQNGGFYTTAFNLSLSTTTSGATILYTLDGSEPDANNLGGTTYQYRNSYNETGSQTPGPLLNNTYRTNSYTAAINIHDRSAEPNKMAAMSSTFHFDPSFYIPESPVFKGTVVRAKLVKPGALASKIVSRTYFVMPQGANQFGLPVISLSLPETSFYDYQNGIYNAGVDFDTWRAQNPSLAPGELHVGNYYRSGLANEKKANLSYFVGGAEVVNANVGIRIRGDSTRKLPSKSLTVYARSDYGDSTLNYPFFSDLPYQQYTRLTLSDSGNDFDESMFRDALAQSVNSALKCENENYQPTITFINGEYWGILQLRERYDNDYFKQVYGFGNVDILENEGDVQEGDDVNFQAINTYIQNNNLSTQANYDYVATQVDPESFADFEIANIFLDHSDWPGNNNIYWRKKTAQYEPGAAYGADGRWRWAFHDFDETFSIGTEDYNHDNLAIATSIGGADDVNPAWSTLWLRKMLQNTTFKNYFINRFADLLNSSYLSAVTLNKLNTMAAGIQPSLPDHFNRWKNSSELFDWEFYINYETDFTAQRPAFQRNHIRSKFSIANNITATLNVSGANQGYIKMNTIEITPALEGVNAATPYPWSGIYFSNIPVTLKAIAKPGFVFSHWTGASTATTAEITLTQASNFNVTAVFVPQNTNASQPIYFWYMGTTIANDTPLSTLNSTYAVPATAAVINYTSCLPGYPYAAGNPLYQHASMERRNSPTSLNYIPEANGGAVYTASAMRGIQIKEPLATATAQDNMVFAFTTVSFEDIKFSFAAKNELTNAQNIVIDYSTVAGTPNWITTGLASSTLPLTADFTLFNVDFSSITAADNNPNFKIRVRFSGTGDMTVDNGNRVTFNNIAVHGTTLLATPTHDEIKFFVYPNPTNGIVNVANVSADATFTLFGIDGKLVKSGTIGTSAQISLDGLTSGMYLLQLTSDGKTETKKIVKK